MSESQMSDSKFAKSFFTMISLLILLTLLLVVLAFINSSEVSQRLDEAKQSRIDEVVATRVEPVGKLNIGEPPAGVEAQVAGSSVAGGSGDSSGSAMASADISGDAVYQQACVACHGAGIAGAPKVGDSSVWADRVTQGMETLYDHAINGYQGSAGVMPAKGGNPSLSDDEVRAAVDHMINESQ